MRVLVTGGAGFIGGHVVDHLLITGHEVLIIDNLDQQVHGPHARWPAWTRAQRAVYPDRCTTIRMDLVHDAFKVYRAIKAFEPTVVIHLAAVVGVGQSATSPGYYAMNNAGGTGNLLEGLGLVDSVERLIVASSMSCYGEGMYRGITDGQPIRPRLRPIHMMEAGHWDYSGLAPVGIAETAELRPTSIYAETKATTERMALIWGDQNDIPTAALRLFNVYGPRQSLRNPYTGVAAIFAGRALRKQPIVVYEDGKQTRDFVHVGDVAEAVSLLAVEERGATFHGPINVGTGRRTQIGALAEQIATELGAEIDVTGEFRAGDVRHCIADASVLRDLGWAPKHEQIQIPELIEWVREQDPVDYATDADPDAELREAGKLHGGAQ